MQTMNDRVIVVDENDQAIGDMDKLEVHQKGLLVEHFLLLYSMMLDNYFFNAGRRRNTIHLMKFN